MCTLLLSILEVAEDFDRFGGTSPELTAWELHLSTETLAPAWERAVADHLLWPTAPDPAWGEQMWRLGGLGRLVLDLARVRGTAPAS